MTRSTCGIGTRFASAIWKNWVGLLQFRLAFVIGLITSTCLGQQNRPPMPATGPWNNDVDLFRIDTSGASKKVHSFERAGVPTAARMSDGRLIAAFQHFPKDDQRNFDRVAISFSDDEGLTWTAPRPMNIQGMEAGMARPFDPTLVPLPDGNVRMYFTSNRSPDFRISTPKIHSAFSKDGLNYVFEPGIRFAVEGRITIDCACALHKGEFHLIVPDNGTAAQMQQEMQSRSKPRALGAYHAISSDGLNFKRIDDLSASQSNRWLGNVQSENGTMFFWGTGPGPWPLTSVDGKQWAASQQSMRITGADPGVVKLRDGSWLILATSPPRRGTMGNDRLGQTDTNSRPMNVATNPSSTRGLQEFGKSPRVQIRPIQSNYRSAPPTATGRFATGQPADLVLGAEGFNRSGGSNVFNHPTGLATDGHSLLMTDRWNNRVLIWKTAPTGNTPPDLVLGQPDFDQNRSGVGLDQMNWPGNVAIAPDGNRIAVTDTNNDRILIWNSFPKKSGQAADLVLELDKLNGDFDGNAASRFDSGRRPMMRMSWPWGVWTDGEKLAVVATHGSAVLLWNQFPSTSNRRPDAVLRPEGAGTPRNVTSDGKTFFAVSDHNYRDPAGSDLSRPATMVWNRWPTEAEVSPDFVWREWLKGSFTPARGLVMAGIQSVFIWDKAPNGANVDPQVFMRPEGYRNGDGPDAVVAQGRLYVCNYNRANLLGWNSLPTRDHQPPDFSVGSDTPSQDTWSERNFIQNPALASDGKSLFVGSDFDRKLFVWKNLPDESGVAPDWVFDLPEGPWDIGTDGTRLAAVGRDTIYLWDSLPLEGEQPSRTLSRNVGGTELRELTGVALDSKYFYVADRQAGAVHVWDKSPDSNTPPILSLEVENPGRLSSDGKYLVVSPFESHDILVYPVDELGRDNRPYRVSGRGLFNLPGHAIAANGRFIVADRSNNRVQVWNDIRDAIAGHPADVFLGAQDGDDRRPGLSERKMIMPGSLAYTPGRLWVGEFKFSTRILRFTEAP